MTRSEVQRPGRHGVSSARVNRRFLRRCIAVLTITLAATAVSTGSATAAPTSSALSATAPAHAVTATAFTVAGRTVPRVARDIALQRFAGGRWTTIAKTRSASDGRYSFVVRPSVAGNWTVRTFAPGTPDHARALSDFVVVTVRSRTRIYATVTAAAAPFGVPSGVTGLVTPTAGGRTVVLEAQTGSRWSRIGETTTDAAGRFDLFVPSTGEGSLNVRVVVPQTPTAAAATGAASTVTTGAPLTTRALATLDVAADTAAITEIGGARRAVTIPVAPEGIARTGRVVWIEERRVDGTQRVFVAGDRLGSTEVARTSNTACVGGAAISNDGTHVAWFTGDWTTVGTAATCVGIERAYVARVTGPATRVALPGRFGRSVGAGIAFTRSDQHVQIVGDDVGGLDTGANVLVNLAGKPVLVSGSTDLGDWFAADVDGGVDALIATNSSGDVARLAIGSAARPVVLARDVVDVSGNADGTRVVYLTGAVDDEHVWLANTDFSDPVDLGRHAFVAGAHVLWAGNDIAVAGFLREPQRGGVRTQVRSTTFELLADIEGLAYAVIG